jgi:hypothetical protein
MAMWSRRDVLRGALGMCVVGVAGVGVAGAQARPPITVYKDPT